MKKIALIISLCVTPAIAFAAESFSFGTLNELATTVADGVVRSVGYLLFTLGVVAFLAGMVKFIWAARNGSQGDDIKNGKQFMLWGLVALFVMFSVWGIITFVQGVFEIKGQNTITIPNVRFIPSNTPTRTSPTPSPAVTPGADSSCVSKAVNDPCTTKNAANQTVSGFCNNSKQCVPSGSGSGGRGTGDNGVRNDTSITPCAGGTIDISTKRCTCPTGYAYNEQMQRCIPPSSGI